MKIRLVFCAGLVLLAVSFGLPPPAYACPWTPVEWQDNGKLRDWVRDTNGNFMDDLIDEIAAAEPDRPIEIIVDLNNCIGEPASSSIVPFLNTLGDVTYVGKYVRFVVVVGVPAREVHESVERPDVAMVELAMEGQWLSPGDNFRAARIETSATYQPNTLEDAFGWSSTLHGNGIGIAFLDTGANATYDPFVTHGYNAIT